MTRAHRHILSGIFFMLAAIYIDSEVASSFMAIVAALNYAMFFVFLTIDKGKDEANTN